MYYLKLLTREDVHMKRALTYLSVILLFSNCLSISAKEFVVRQNPYINNPYYRQQEYFIDKVLPSDLTALEKYSMNKTYNREAPLRRLERLENLAFGSIQEGDLRARYKNVETAILSRPRPNQKRTALGNLANYFAGQATGITPSIFTNYGNGYSYDSYTNPYNSGFGTQRINQYSNGIFGSGYSILNNNFGNGSAIRILD